MKNQEWNEIQNFSLLHFSIKFFQKNFLQEQNIHVEIELYARFVHYYGIPVTFQSDLFVSL